MSHIDRGSFKNYVEEMRWVDGPTMYIFVHVQCENAQVEVGELQKRGKIMST